MWNLQGVSNCLSFIARANIYPLPTSHYTLLLYAGCSHWLPWGAESQKRANCHRIIGLERTVLRNTVCRMCWNIPPFLSNWLLGKEFLATSIAIKCWNLLCNWLPPSSLTEPFPNLEILLFMPCWLGVSTRVCSPVLESPCLPQTDWCVETYCSFAFLLSSPSLSENSSVYMSESTARSSKYYHSRKPLPQTDQSACACVNLIFQLRITINVSAFYLFENVKMMTTPCCDGNLVCETWVLSIPKLF